jgi:hypothetical protein
MSAEEILKESGNRKDASMRHFTGMWIHVKRQIGREYEQWGD